MSELFKSAKFQQTHQSSEGAKFAGRDSSRRSSSPYRVVLLGVLGVALACGAALTSRAWAAGAAAAVVVAVVNGTGISEADLDTAVKASGLADTPSLRKVLTEQLVNDELIRQAAEAKEYAKRAEVREAAERAQTQAMMVLYLRDTVKPAPVTDEDVKKAYGVMLSDLGDKKYKPSVIVVKDQQSADEVIAKAKKGEAFATLATQYSVAANRNSGGAMSWFSYRLPTTEGHTAGLPQAFASELAKLKVGRVSPAVQIDGVFYIIRLDEVESMEKPSYDSVEKALRGQLEQAATNAATVSLLDSLKAHADIKNPGV